MTQERTTHTESESQALMHTLWTEVISHPHISDKPLVFMFYGNLGVGKTACVKALARELGVEDIVSPAFVVYYEYLLTDKPFKALYHFDLYRIQDAHEFDYLGMRDILVPGHVVMIEWSEKSDPIEHLLAEAYVIKIRIEHGTHDNRHFTLEYP